MRSPSAARATRSPPASAEEWDALKNATNNELRERGFCLWCGLNFIEKYNDYVECEDEKPTHNLWLLPGEWYSSIPINTELVNINIRTISFIPGKTSDDIRFGCLAYGFIIPNDL